MSLRSDHQPLRMYDETPDIGVSLRGWRHI